MRYCLIQQSCSVYCLYPCLLDNKKLKKKKKNSNSNSKKKKKKKEKYSLGIIWDDLFISEVKLKLCLIFQNFQNGRHFELATNFFTGSDTVPDTHKFPLNARIRMRCERMRAHAMRMRSHRMRMHAYARITDTEDAQITYANARMTHEKCVRMQCDANARSHRMRMLA